ncbi:MAG TPA: molybdopterin dinucleotide binding domain-containing protein, partial [Ramlibacter sp.]|nr:molybdopterin dinucleotide binding domain-containing protein [Ramlibacter sp.]
LRIGFEVSPRAMEQVQLRQPVVRPAPGNLARSDLQIVFDLAMRLGLGEHFAGGDIERACDEVLAPIGLSMAQLRAQPEGVRVPLPQPERAYERAGFGTPSGRVEFHSDAFAAAGIPPVPRWVPPAVGSEPEFPYTLSCAKSGYFCQSQHRALPSLRLREPQPLVRLHPDLAQRHGIAAGDGVEVRTPTGFARYRAEYDEALQPDVVHASFGWWQACEELGLPALDPLQAGSANPNAIVDASLLDGPSGSAPLRSYACGIRLAGGVPGWNDTMEAEVRRVSTSGRVLELAIRAADGRLLPDYLPGQHVRIAVDLPGVQGLERCYSLVGPAFDPQRREYRIGVGLSREGGAVSAALHRAFAAAPDARLEVRLRRPAGRFLLPAAPARPVVLLAAGVGITPFLSLLESWAAGDPPRVPVLLLHGCRAGEEQPFGERLRELQARLPMLELRVSHRQIGAASVQDHWLSGTFYLCGPAGMSPAIADGLGARGVRRHDVFSESFRLAPSPAPAAAEGRRVRFARSGVEARWTAADHSLLALADRLGVPLAGGCRVGQCETCRVPLRSGEVWHRSEPAALEPGECLACVAVPVTDLEVDA